MIKIGDKITLKEWNALPLKVRVLNMTDKEDYDKFLGNELTVGEVEDTKYGLKVSFKEEDDLFDFSAEDIFIKVITNTPYKYTFSEEYIATLNGVEYSFERKGFNELSLNDTVELMRSSDYRERFLAEYWQVKIRYDKLKAMCDKWDRKELEFTPTCPRAIYEIQLDAMNKYLSVLEERAIIENVELGGNDNE